MARIEMRGFLVICSLLLITLSPCFECSIFPSRIPSRIMLTRTLPMSQENEESKLPLMGSLTSLTALALDKLKSLPWRYIHVASVSGVVRQLPPNRFFKIVPLKPHKVENETKVAKRKSLTASTLVKLGSLPWRKIVSITGTVTAAGFLTSVVVASMRQQQETAATHLVNTEEILLPMPKIDSVDRLETIFNSTDLYAQPNMNESTSVLLVFDSNESLGLEKAVISRNNALDIITAEVNKARLEGEKIQAIFIPSRVNNAAQRNVTDAMELAGKGWSVLDESIARHHKISATLRSKYCIEDDDIRVLLVRSGDEQVVANNVLDVMRFAPQYTPWVGASALKPQLTLQALAAGAPVYGPSGANETVTLCNSTSGKLALFFGAEWSDSCRNIVPLLRAAYSALQKKEIDSGAAQTEFVYVSLDQNEADFERFRKDLPFTAVPFNDRRRALLQMGMHIRSVPSLVFLSNGSVTSSSGITDLLSEPNILSRSVVNLGSGSSIEKMRHAPVLIAFIDNCSIAMRESVKAALLLLEDELQSVPHTFPQTSRSNLVISYIEQSGELATLLRTLVHVPTPEGAVSTDTATGNTDSEALLSGQPQFALLDMANENIAANIIDVDDMDGFILSKSPSHTQCEKLVDALKKFVSKYRSYELKTFPLQAPIDSENEDRNDDDEEVESIQDVI